MQPLLAIGAVEINAINLQAPELRLQLAQQQAQNRAFTATAGAHQGQGTAGGDGQTEVGQTASIWVAELNLIEHQPLGQWRRSGQRIGGL